MRPIRLPFFMILGIRKKLEEGINFRFRGLFQGYKSGGGSSGADGGGLAKDGKGRRGCGGDGGCDGGCKRKVAEVVVKVEPGAAAGRARVAASEPESSTVNASATSVSLAVPHGLE